MGADGSNPTMSRIRPTPRVVALPIVLALVALMVAPTGAFAFAGPTGVGAGSPSSAASTHPISAVSAATHGSPLASHPGVTPGANVAVGNRAYQTRTSALPGVVQDGRIATDSATGTVYSVSQVDSLVTAYNGTTGLLLRSVLLTNDSGYAFGTDIAYDNLSGQLYVGVSAFGGAQIDVLNAATFAFVTNISFAASGVPNFVPFRMLFDYRTPQLLVENSSTQDVFVVDVATNSLALFLPVACSGYQPLGCTSTFGMFFMDTAFGWLAILPAGSGYAWSISLSGVPSLDAVAAGFNGTIPNFLFGPGAFSSATNFTYFMNRSGDGVIAAYLQSGTYSGSAATGAATPFSLVVDPASGWLVLASQNVTGAGAQLYGLSPLTGAVVWTTSNLTLPSYQQIGELAIFDAPNGTGYLATAGFFASTAQLVLLLPSTAPYGVVVATYQGIPTYEFQVIADPALGLFYEAADNPNEVIAFSEATGAIQWVTPLTFSQPPEGDGMSVDVAHGTLYVSTPTFVWALSASTGGVYGTLGTPNTAYYTAVGFGNLLYLTDSFNDTILVYSIAGAPGTFVWTATIQLAAASNPCTLSASPVAAVVADLSCGLGTVVQINTVAARATVKNVTGWAYGYAANFNATGDLYVGNDTASHWGVQVYSAGTWATGRLIPAPVPVNVLDFVPAVNGVLVANESSANASFLRGPIAVVNASTGATLGWFHTPGPLQWPAADAASGAIAGSTQTAQLLIANLVATPSAATGLAVHPGNTTLNVSWSAASAPNGFPVTTYNVFTSAAATGPWAAAGSTSSTSVTVSSLTDGTTYYVTVRAVGSSGTGPAATPASGVPLGVPYPPTALASGAVTTTTVALSWHAPSVTDGAAVTGYTVLYAKSASGPWTTVSAGASTNATVSSLSAGTTYFFEVEAANSVGTGHPTSSITASTSSSSGPGGLLGGSGGSTWLLIGLAIAIVLIVVGVAAFLMMRRRSGGSSGSQVPPSPPSGATGGAETAPPPPPPG
jgi:hypothetical protein